MALMSPGHTGRHLPNMHCGPDAWHTLSPIFLTTCPRSHSRLWQTQDLNKHPAPRSELFHSAMAGASRSKRQGRCEDHTGVRLEGSLRLHGRREGELTRPCWLGACSGTV